MNPKQVRKEGKKEIHNIILDILIIKLQNIFKNKIVMSVTEDNETIWISKKGILIGYIDGCLVLQ